MDPDPEHPTRIPHNTHNALAATASVPDAAIAFAPRALHDLRPRCPLVAIRPTRSTARALVARTASAAAQRTACQSHLTLSKYSTIYERTRRSTRKTTRTNPDPKRPHPLLPPHEKTRKDRRKRWSLRPTFRSRFPRSRMLPEPSARATGSANRPSVHPRSLPTPTPLAPTPPLLPPPRRPIPAQARAASPFRAHTTAGAPLGAVASKSPPRAKQ